MVHSQWVRGCAFALLVVTAAAPLAANEPVVPPAKKAEATSTPDERYASARQRIERTLDEPLASPLSFPATPLNQIVEVISDDYDIPIIFDTASLDSQAVSPETEVSVRIADTTLRTALELMLDQIDDVTYVVEKEVLLITTKQSASERLETIVYRVDDLLLIDPSQSIVDEDLDYDSLIDLIVSTIDHETWMEAGTGEGEIVPFRPGMLVVSQHQSVHRQIERLLAELRRHKAAILSDHPLKPDSAPRAVTSSINYNDTDVAGSEDARLALEQALIESVDWRPSDVGLGANDVFLRVLPNKILVRHSPRVVQQVDRLVSKLWAPPEGYAAASKKPAGRGGGMGGRGGF